MHPLALIHRSNLGEHEKSSIRHWVETALGKTDSEERHALQSRAKNHIVEAGANVRGVGTGLVTGAILGTIDAAHGLDHGHVAVDMASAAVLSVIAIGAAHDVPELAKTARDMAIGGAAIFGHRKSKEWSTMKHGGAAAAPAAAKVHGDDQGLVDFARGMHR